MSRPLVPPPGGAAVRMYCTGFGDCFLLAFAAAGGDPAYVWIDCGGLSHASTPGKESDWFAAIMADIRDTVAPHGVRLLVVTHKHLDHLSGFYVARDIFREIDVHETWMPWTEDPGDAKAVSLARRERELLAAAQRVASRLRAVPLTPGGRESEYASLIDGVMAFGGLGLVGISTDDMLNVVRERRPPEYQRPDRRPRSIAGVPDLRIHVLGPPTKADFLRRMDPTEGEESREVYMRRDVGGDVAFALGVAHMDTPADAPPRNASPFSNRFVRPTASARALAAAPTIAPEDMLATLLSRLEGSPGSARAWRNIEHDWLASSSRMALKCDSFRNNTSLALAFELFADGPVLLFPGDAQVGNWLSWHHREGGDGPLARELLDRTVLYKVGHHGSENATLRNLGLELMGRRSPHSRGRLVALVPTSRVVAQSKTSKRNPDGWQIPYPQLMSRLDSACGGRVICADQAGRWRDALTAAGPPAGLDPAAWSWFKDATRVELDPTTNAPLYVEYRVPARPA